MTPEEIAALRKQGKPHVVKSTEGIWGFICPTRSNKLPGWVGFPNWHKAIVSANNCARYCDWRYCEHDFAPVQPATPPG